MGIKQNTLPTPSNFFLNHVVIEDFKRLFKRFSQEGLGVGLGLGMGVGVGISIRVRGRVSVRARVGWARGPGTDRTTDQSTN